MQENCKHCHHSFQPKRKNNIYCCSSCKTMASYKRNNYKYSPGHYQKDNTLPDKKIESLMIPLEKLEDKLSVIEQKKETINITSVSNAAIGAAAANTLTYGLKKALAPFSLPATKGDIQQLKNEIQKLKEIIMGKMNNPFWS